MQILDARRELARNADLYETVSVMRDVAIAQYHALLKRDRPYESFARDVRAVFAMADFDTVAYSFLWGNPAAPEAVLMVTSDMGFMGPLNTRVMESALGYVRSRPPAGIAPCRLAVIGRSGAEYLREQGCVFDEFPGVPADMLESLGAASRIAGYIAEEIAAGRTGAVMVFFPRSSGFSVQEVVQTRVAPVEGLPPAVRRSPPDTAARGRGEPVIWESPKEDAAALLCRMLAAAALYSIFEESKVAEFAARAAYLEECLHGLKEAHREMSLVYTRLRHGLLDKSLREISMVNMILSSEK